MKSLNWPKDANLLDIKRQGIGVSGGLL
jgi:hypothetical protein